MLSCLPTIPDAGGLVKAAAAVQPVYLPMERDYEGDETRALAMELAAYLWFRQKAAAKILRVTVSSCTNSGIRLRDFPPYQTRSNLQKLLAKPVPHCYNTHINPSGGLSHELFAKRLISDPGAQPPYRLYAAQYPVAFYQHSRRYQWGIHNCSLQRGAEAGGWRASRPRVRLFRGL